MENIWSKRSSGFMQDLMKATEFELKSNIQQAKKTKSTTLELDLRDTNSNNISIRKVSDIKRKLENSSDEPCSPDQPKLITKFSKLSENLEPIIYSENDESVEQDPPLSTKKRKLDDTVENLCINNTKRCKENNIAIELRDVEKKLETEELSEPEDEFLDLKLTMSPFFHILDIPGISSQEEKDVKKNSNEEFERCSNDSKDCADIKVNNSFLFNEDKAKEPPDSKRIEMFSKKLFQEYPEFSKNELSFSNKFIPEETLSLNWKATFISDIKKSPQIMPEVEESLEFKGIFKSEDLLNISNTESFEHHKRLEKLVLKCYECHICFEEFKYSKILIQHIECHGIGNYQCVECEFCSKDVLEFYRHRAAHANTKPFTCNLCDYETVLMEELTEHVLHHYEKLYECNMCYYTSRLKEDLEEHIKTHDKEIELEEHRILIDDSLHFQENILWQVSNSPFKNVEFLGSLKNDALVQEKEYSNPTPIKNESNEISRPSVQNNIHMISCDICDYECNKKSLLDMHMIAHSGGRKYKCSQCTYSCRQKQNLNRHMEKHIDKKYLKCPECNYKSHKKYNFERHLARHAMHPKEKSYNCKSIDSQDHKNVLEKTLVMKNHSNKKQYESLYRCKECSFACDSNIELMFHRLELHQYFRCEECNYKSNKKDSIMKHLQKHLEKYKECNHGCKCSKCEYWTYKKTELDTLALIDKSKKRHKCNQCNFAFRRISDLKRHIMTHTGEKPFKCTQCDYATSRSHSLRIHQTLRHSTNVFNCSKCEYISKSTKDLKVHQKTCFQENSLKCHHCNYICNNQAALNGHLNKHKNIFKCNLCDYVCAQDAELKKHMISMHPRKYSKSLKNSKLKSMKSKKINLKRIKFSK